MDIFKMASQIANSMSEDDKSAMENMDMEKMISHVTKNVFKIMSPGGPQASNPLSDLMGSMNIINETLPKTRDICFDLNVDLADFYTSKKKKNMLGGISNAEDEDMGLPFGIRKAITLRKVDKKPLNMHMFNADNEVSLEDRMYFLNQLDDVPIKEMDEDNINSVKNLYKSMERKLKKLK